MAEDNTLQLKVEMEIEYVIWGVPGYIRIVGKKSPVHVSEVPELALDALLGEWGNLMRKKAADGPPPLNVEEKDKAGPRVT